MKILLVEDNVSLCRNIASVLQNEGYTVVTCSNGNEAEFQMLNNSSDLILLDRMLPGKRWHHTDTGSSRGWYHSADSSVDGAGYPGR